MLHKLLKLGFFCLTSVIFTGCGGSSSNSIENAVEYIPVQLRKGKNWSFVDSKGKIIAEDEFKNEPSVVVNGMFSVKEGKNYSLYNIKDLKHEVLNGLVSVGIYNEGIVPITKKNERITLVENNGKVKATLLPVDGKEIIRCANAVVEGMLAITNEDGVVGYADASGKVMIKPQYSLVFGFSEGLALVIKQNKENKEEVSVIDKSGKQLFTIDNDYSIFAYGFNKGLLPVRNNKLEVSGFFNKKGEFIKVNSKVQEMGTYNAKYFAYKSSDNEWGIMDMAGETVVKAKYDGICILSDGDFFATQRNNDNDNEKYDCFILDKNGEKKLSFEGYKYVRPYNSHFGFIGQINNKYAILNKKGEQIGKEDFANIGGLFWSDNLLNNPVNSDFFNPTSVVNALTENLGMGRIGKYCVGKYVSTLGITDYDNYVGKYIIKDTDLNKQGYGFSTSFEAETNEPIARRTGEFDSFYNWNSYVVPNQNAKIQCAVISASVEKSCWNDIKQHLTQKIQGLGYTVRGSGEDDVCFDGQGCILVLKSSNNGTNIDIIVADRVLTQQSLAAEAAESVEKIDW